MLRLILLLAVLVVAWASLPGCEEKSSEQQKEFKADMDKGRRPEPSEKRAPPGPGKEGAGFQQGDPGQLPPGKQTPPPPPGKGAKGGKGGG